MCDPFELTNAPHPFELTNLPCVSYSPHRYSKSQEIIILQKCNEKIMKPKGSQSSRDQTSSCGGSPRRPGSATGSANEGTPRSKSGDLESKHIMKNSVIK